MKKLLVCAVAVAIAAACGSAFAQGKVWDDFSWWGQSGATPAPVKDARENYPGYWWWPLEAKSNANDSELWGNRGVVYNMLAEKKAEVTPSPPPPPSAPQAAPPRVKPVYAHVLFDFDKSVLKPEGKAEVDKVVADMKKYSKDSIVIEGHTCNIGTDEYNMGLGQRRADAVKKYMVEQGIDAGRVTTKSLGESKPAVPNDMPANRKLNRRVVFEVNVVN